MLALLYKVAIALIYKKLEYYIRDSLFACEFKDHNRIYNKLMLKFDDECFCVLY